MSRKSDTKKSSATTETDRSTTANAMETTTPDRPPRFDPFAQMHLGEWFERWPEIFARRWPESLQGLPFGDAAFRMEQFIDEDASMVIRAELPGLDADKDVTVTVDGDRLKIAGTRQERTREKTDGAVRSEFHYGSFERSLHLPTGARTDAIKATYNSGILEVRIPCDGDEATVTTIPIKTND